MFTSASPGQEPTLSVTADHDTDPRRRDGLSGAVLARYEAIIDARDQAFDATRQIWERIQALRAERNDAQLELRRLAEADAAGRLIRETRSVDPKTGGPVAVREVDTERLQAAERTLQLAKDRLERAEIQFREGNARRSAYARVAARLDEYLDAHRGRIVEATGPVSKAKLGKGESPADAVARIRITIADRQREMTALRIAPLTTVEAKQQARVEVDRLAASGRPNVTDLFRQGGKVEWPMLTVPGIDVGGYKVRLIDGAALTAFLFKDTLRAAVDAEVEAVGAEMKGAVSARERALRQAEIDREVLMLSYDEQAFIDLAAEGGHLIPPRVDADPRAVLGLDSSSPKPPKEKL